MKVAVVLTLVWLTSAARAQECDLNKQFDLPFSVVGDTIKFDENKFKNVGRYTQGTTGYDKEFPPSKLKYYSLAPKTDGKSYEVYLYTRPGKIDVVCLIHSDEELVTKRVSIGDAAKCQMDRYTEETDNRMVTLFEKSSCEKVLIKKGKLNGYDVAMPQFMEVQKAHNKTAPFAFFEDGKLNKFDDDLKGITKFAGICRDYMNLPAPEPMHGFRIQGPAPAARAASAPAPARKQEPMAAELQQGTAAPEKGP